MHNTEDDADGVEEVLGRREADEPVEDVEEAVAAQRYEVEAVQYGWHGGLAEEEELGKHADAFEDDAEGPEDLSRARSETGRSYE